MYQTRRSETRRLAFSLMELLIVVAIIMIIGTIAVPKINQTMVNAKEMAAMRELHNLNTAQMQYMSSYQRFAASLVELGPPTSGQASPTSSDLITTEMSKGAKNGYKFQVQATPAGYSVSAIPVSFPSTGRRTFFTDQTGVIRQNWGAEPATANSDEFK